MSVLEFIENFVYLIVFKECKITTLALRNYFTSMNGKVDLIIQVNGFYLKC